MPCWIGSKSGEEIVITRRGKPVAELVPAGPGFDRAKARRAVAGLLEASRGVTLGGLKIKDLISEDVREELCTGQFRGADVVLRG